MAYQQLTQLVAKRIREVISSAHHNPPPSPLASVMDVDHLYSLPASSTGSLMPYADTKSSKYAGNESPPPVAGDGKINPLLTFYLISMMELVKRKWKWLFHHRFYVLDVPSALGEAKQISS